MNTGIFVLGFVLAIFGFLSDVLNYYDTYSLLLIIGGLILIVIGAVMPSISTSTVHKEAPVTTERRVKTVVRED